MTTADDGPDAPPPPGDPVAQHLQQAAREAIAAARAFLDAVDAMVADPRGLETVNRLVAGWAAAGREAMRPDRAGPTASGPADGTDGDDDAGGGRVTRIRVD